MSSVSAIILRWLVVDNFALSPIALRIYDFDDEK